MITNGERANKSTNYYLVLSTSLNKSPTLLMMIRELNTALKISRRIHASNIMY